MKNKKFLYSSICFNPDAKMYSINTLTKGEVYDIYFAQYAFTEEYEIFKDNVYYTSFIKEHNEHVHLRWSVGTENIKLGDYFYTESQMRDIKINKVLG